MRDARPALRSAAHRSASRRSASRRTASHRNAPLRTAALRSAPTWPSLNNSSMLYVTATHRSAPRRTAPPRSAPLRLPEETSDDIPTSPHSGASVTAIDVPNRRGNLTPLGRWCRERRVAYHDLAGRVGLTRRELVRIATGEEPTSWQAILLHFETGLPLAALIRGFPP